MSKFKVGKDSGIINAQIRQTLGHLVAKGVLTQTAKKTFKMVKLLSRMKMRKQWILELLDRGIKVHKIAKIVGCTYDTARRTVKDKKAGEDLDFNDEGANSGSDQQNLLDETDPLAGTPMHSLDSHPSYITMVIKAITTLRKEKKWQVSGVSWQAITQFITSNYQVKDDSKSVKNQVKQTLRKHVARGELTDKTGAGKRLQGYRVVPKKLKMLKLHGRTLHIPNILGKGTKMPKIKGTGAPTVTTVAKEGNTPTPISFFDNVKSREKVLTIPDIGNPCASISYGEIPQNFGAYPATVEDQTTSNRQLFSNMKPKEENLIEESDADFHQRHNMNVLDLLEDNDDDFIEAM